MRKIEKKGAIRRIVGIGEIERIERRKGIGK